MTRPRRAITIGNFDGVHLGHRALLDRARAHAGPDGEVVAMALHPHPLTRLRPERAPREIEPWAARSARLLDAGADRVVRLEPTANLLGMSPEAFVGWLAEAHAPTHLVEGPDFCFGKGRAGSVRTLTALAEPHGISVEVVPPVVVALRDQSEVVASSTLVRWLLAHGRVRDAAFVLGRPHELWGVVVPGDRLGRTIGFPTANLETAGLCPGEGIYAASALLPDGSEAIAAVHVGPRPAIDRPEHRVEAHLLDPAGGAWNPPDGMPESGWRCTLRLIGRVRDVVRVDGLGPLVEQIRRDCNRCRAIVGPVLSQPPRDAVASEPR